jgi:hypothetical protein
MIAAIKGSMGIAAAVLFWDVAYEGFYLFSALICPPWFLISFIKNIIQRPGWAIALLRVSTSLLTFAIAFGNGNLQWNVSDANAQRVIKACEDILHAVRPSHVIGECREHGLHISRVKPFVEMFNQLFVIVHLTAPFGHRLKSLYRWTNVLVSRK